MMSEAEGGPIERRRLADACTFPISTRRRKWSDDVKIAMVAETSEPCTDASNVAHHHDVTPSQLFGWMRRFCDEAWAWRTPPEAPLFTLLPVVDVALIELAPPASSPVPTEAAGEIELTVGGVNCDQNLNFANTKNMQFLSWTTIQRITRRKAAFPQRLGADHSGLWRECIETR